MRHWTLIVLAGCATHWDPQERPADYSPPPGTGGLTLSGPDNVVEGQSYTWEVRAADLDPGVRVNLAWGSTVQPGPCPYSRMIGGWLCLDINGPARRLAGATAIDDPANPGTGLATFDLTAPPYALGSVNLQAISIDGLASATSNVLTVEINQPSQEQFAFVTSTTYTGNLGGIAGADAKCAAAGANSPHPDRDWRAILSVPGDDARDRLIVNGEIWTFDPAGEPADLVADDFDDLWDGDVHHVINRREDGTPGSFSYVWSGTQDDGTAHSFSCNSFGNFPSSGNDSTGYRGSALLSWPTTWWIDNGNWHCTTNYPIFCLSQPNL